MKNYSLRWRFTIGFIVLQLCAIPISLGLIAYAASGIKSGDAIPSIWLSDGIAESLKFGTDGKAALAPTPELSKMIATWPSLWFVVDMPDGSSITHGQMPEKISASAPFLKSFRSVDLHGYLDEPTSVAQLQRVQTAAGEATILMGGMSMSQLGLIIVLGNLAIGVPSIILAVITLIGVPLVTRWSLRSFNELTDRLDRVDFEARGGTVNHSGLPREVLGVVEGINMALRRLDNGFETTEQFFVNAAHELRTPIAVLQIRCDTLPSSEEKSHIQTSIKRLTAITNQLLDIEKYRQKPPGSLPVELNGVVSNVVADLAPLAFAAGYEISFESKTEQVFVVGEADALERAFANLIRNAIQYGGKGGEISVGIETDGSVYVRDQGPGIPHDKHERIFEPFYRINPQGSGAGLGLSMVKDIVSSHGGTVSIVSAPDAGTTFVVRWPNAKISPLRDTWKSMPG